MGTPPARLDSARLDSPRADSVRIVEHAPVCQLAVESFKNPCHELQVLLARLFGPNMPKPLFRIVVEFWLGRGLPYKYSRDYLPEPEGDFPSQPGNDFARNYIREGL